MDRFPRIFPFLAFRHAATAAYGDTSGYDSRCQGYVAPTLAKAGQPYSEVTNTPCRHELTARPGTPPKRTTTPNQPTSRSEHRSELHEPSISC